MTRLTMLHSWPRRLLAVLLCMALVTTVAADPAKSSCPPEAQMPTAEQVRIGMQNAKDHGFLWRISRGGHSSYLYGTLHVARFEWMFPGPAMLAALKASDTVALELDMLDANVRRQMLEGMKVKLGPLPESLHQRLLPLVRAECIPEDAFFSNFPEMQIATLMVLLGRRDGFDPSYGIDMALSGMAHGARKRVVSLETPELQLKTIRMRNPAETLEFVSQALDEIESGKARAMLVEIAHVWADSDISKLMTYPSWCDCIKTPNDHEHMVRLNDDRNPKLADSIAALHDSGQRVFAAVGSMHMMGPKGLPKLLGEMGFQVDQVLPAGTKADSKGRGRSVKPVPLASSSSH